MTEKTRKTSKMVQIILCLPVQKVKNLYAATVLYEDHICEIRSIVRMHDKNNGILKRGICNPINISEFCPSTEPYAMHSEVSESHFKSEWTPTFTRIRSFSENELWLSYGKYLHMVLQRDGKRCRTIRIKVKDLMNYYARQATFSSSTPARY